MGLFLGMSGVIGGDTKEVEDALLEYCGEHSGRMERVAAAPDVGDCLAMTKSPGGVSVLYPGEFMGWEEASEELSRSLGRAVFSFHVHDGDLWMYTLYLDGDAVDQFNPVPDYWGEIEPEERASWKGDAEEVVRHVPGVKASTISRYLVPWGEDILQSTERRKAYPDDEYPYGDDWQVADFMKRVGLAYPLNDDGSPKGDFYRFVCDPKA